MHNIKALATVCPALLCIVYDGSQAHLVFEKFALDELLKPEDREIRASNHDNPHLHLTPGRLVRRSAETSTPISPSWWVSR